MVFRVGPMDTWAFKKAFQMIPVGRQDWNHWPAWPHLRNNTLIGRETEA